LVASTGPDSLSTNKVINEVAIEDLVNPDAVSSDKIKVQKAVAEEAAEEAAGDEQLGDEIDDMEEIAEDGAVLEADNERALTRRRPPPGLDFSKLMQMLKPQVKDVDSTTVQSVLIDEGITQRLKEITLKYEEDYPGERTKIQGFKQTVESSAKTISESFNKLRSIRAALDRLNSHIENMDVIEETRQFVSELPKEIALPSDVAGTDKQPGEQLVELSAFELKERLETEKERLTDEINDMISDAHRASMDYWTTMLPEHDGTLDGLIHSHRRAQLEDTELRQMQQLRQSGQLFDQHRRDEMLELLKLVYAKVNPEAAKSLADREAAALALEATNQEAAEGDVIGDVDGDFDEVEADDEIEADFAQEDVVSKTD